MRGWVICLEKMKEVPRGGRSWFAVESKSFEILIDEVGGKLRGCIWERCKGITSWIRFGDVSLSRLLAGIETCCRGRDDKGWSLVWEEEGRKYRLERCSNEAGRFLLCFVLKKEKEPEPRTYADVAKSKTGRWENGATPPLELDFLKNCAGHAWLLKGKLNIVVLGRRLLLFEFDLLREAEHVFVKREEKGERQCLIFGKMAPRGYGCGGLIVVDENTNFMVELQWARLLVKVVAPAGSVYGKGDTGDEEEAGSGSRAMHTQRGCLQHLSTLLAQVKATPTTKGISN
ncbi:hypothetical protein CK203_080691 [Vitis vinifera]|uniref:DUF4283 domain-containing protein n=1 Tax=Vitis vinifera TaxID=29760 RepID=A0A438DZK6_VITVI|nr:hypothetical protein CK203_080691 [Vitis vinifera]